MVQLSDQSCFLKSQINVMFQKMKKKTRHIFMCNTAFLSIISHELLIRGCYNSISIKNFLQLIVKLSPFFWGGRLSLEEEYSPEDSVGLESPESEPQSKSPNSLYPTKSGCILFIFSKHYFVYLPKIHNKSYLKIYLSFTQTNVSKNNNHELNIF